MTNHPLEHNLIEKAFFEEAGAKGSKNARSAYRRALEAVTGSLPTWAERGAAGRKPKKAQPPKAQSVTGEAK